ncbi:MAG: hypothetical protein HGB10_07120 [Coriobacteriia bacterium]|nr:hypothetical protein [Coriobacteriia bacterium]
MNESDRPPTEDELVDALERRFAASSAPQAPASPALGVEPPHAPGRSNSNLWVWVAAGLSIGVVLMLVFSSGGGSGGGIRVEAPSTTSAIQQAAPTSVTPPQSLAPTGAYSSDAAIIAYIAACQEGNLDAAFDLRTMGYRASSTPGDLLVTRSNYDSNTDTTYNTAEFVDLPAEETYTSSITDLGELDWLNVNEDYTDSKEVQFNLYVGAEWMFAGTIHVVQEDGYWCVDSADLGTMSGE